MHVYVLNKLNIFLLRLEQKTGRTISALIVGILLIGIAALYVTPALSAMQLGRGYASLSTAPFDFSEPNPLRFRILTPLLAYCIGLRGNAYIIFPLVIAVLFLAFIYFQLRKKEDASVSILITMMICFSTPILFLLHYAGYVDVTSYLLICLAFVYRKSIYLFSAFLVLLLLNHDSNVFILPAVLFCYYMNSENKAKGLLFSAIAVGIAIVPFFLYRKYISALSPVDYNAGMYFSQIKENLKTIASYFPLGFFYAFKLFWLFPAIAIYLYLKERNWNLLILFALILSGVLGQLLLASDTSRLIGLAFPIIILGAIKVKEKWGTELFLKRTFYIILFNFFIPQYYIGQSVMIKFYTLPSSWILKHYYGIETWIN